MSLPDWIAANGEMLQISSFCGGFAALALLERWFPVRGGGARRRRWAANLSLTLLSLLVLGLLPTSFIAAALWTREHGLGLVNGLGLSVGWTVATTLLLRGFLSFATHYLMHRVPAFWRCHRVHHLDTELDVSTTVRFHPMELVIGLVLGVPFVVALGLEPWVLMLYEVLDVAGTLFSHADLRLPERADQVLRPLIVTPNLHRIHHSAWQPETDSNFSAVFPIRDIVFGTFRPVPRQPHATMRLGLDEARGPETNAVGWLPASPLRGFPGPTAAIHEPLAGIVEGQ